jgi:hypothetical protein
MNKETSPMRNTLVEEVTMLKAIPMMKKIPEAYHYDANI